MASARGVYLEPMTCMLANKLHREANGLFCTIILYIRRTQYDRLSQQQQSFLYRRRWTATSQHGHDVRNSWLYYIGLHRRRTHVFAEMGSSRTVLNLEPRGQLEEKMWPWPWPRPLGS